MPCHDIQEEAIPRHHVVVAKRIYTARGPKAQSGNGIVRVTILVHQLECGREPRGRDVLVPLALVALIEPLAQGCGLRRHHLSLTCQQVNCVGRVAFLREVVSISCGDGAQVDVSTIHEALWHALAARGGFEQEMLRIQRYEFLYIVSAWPQPIGAFIVQTHSQLIDETVDVSAGLRPNVSKFWARGEQQRGHRLTDELLGAGIRIVAEVRNEPVRKAERHHGDGSSLLAEFGIQSAVGRYVDGAPLQCSGFERSHEGRCRPDAYSNAPLRTGSAAPGREQQVNRPQLVRES